MRDDIEEFFEDNTVPLALIGVGIGWMLMSGARHTETYEQAVDWAQNRTGGMRRRLSRSYGSTRRHMEDEYGSLRGQARDAMDSVRRGAEQLRERAGVGRSGQQDTSVGYDRIADYDARSDENGLGAGTGQAMDRLRGMGRTVGERARYANRSLWQMIDEYPVAAGLMGLALGAAVGATLPATRTEDEWLGESRDGLIARARREGADYMTRAGRVARDAAEAGAEAARQTVADSAEREELTPQGTEPVAPSR